MFVSLFLCISVCLSIWLLNCFAFQCHLPSSTSESFTIHVDQRGAPFGLDYFVGPVPHDGACPGQSKSQSRGGRKAGSSPAQLRPITNTTVTLRSPTFPPLCVLYFFFLFLFISYFLLSFSSSDWST